MKGNRNRRPLKNFCSSKISTAEHERSACFDTQIFRTQYTSAHFKLGLLECLPMGAANWLTSDIESSYICTAHPCTEAPVSIISHSDLYNNELSML